MKVKLGAIAVVMGLAEVVRFIIGQTSPLRVDQIMYFLLIFLMLVGLYYKNQILCSIGIAGFLPSFLLGIQDVLDGKQISIHVIIFIISCVIILTREITDYYLGIVGGFLYNYILYLPEYSIFNGLFSIFDVAFQSGFSFVVYFSAYGMIGYLYLKHLEKKSPFIHRRVHPPTQLEQYLNQRLPSELWRKNAQYGLLLFGVFVTSIIKVLLQGPSRVILTISLWAFVISFFIPILNNKYFSSQVVSVAIPIIFLMIFESPHDQGWFYVFLNALFHFVPVVAAYYVFFKKQNAQWDIIMIFGYALMLTAYLITTLMPNYIINVDIFKYFTFVVNMVVPACYFFYVEKCAKTEGLKKEQEEKIANKKERSAPL